MIRQVERWPDPEPCFGEELILRNIEGVPCTRIARVITVVAHHEVRILGDNDRSEVLATGSFPQVGLVERLGGVIDINLAVPDLDLLTGETDNSLNKRLFLVVGELEEDDLASLGISEDVGKPAAQINVIDLERVLHRTGDNFSLDDDELVDESGEDKSYTDDDGPIRDLGDYLVLGELLRFGSALFVFGIGGNDDLFFIIFHDQYSFMYVNNAYCSCGTQSKTSC